MVTETTERTLTPAMATAEEAERSFRRQYMPGAQYTLSYEVKHDYYGGTWLVLNGWGEELPRRRGSKKRYAWTSQRPVEQLADDNFGHAYGACPGCTQRFRVEHGQPADVSDLQAARR